MHSQSIRTFNDGIAVRLVCSGCRIEYNVILFCGNLFHLVNDTEEPKGITISKDGIRFKIISRSVESETFAAENG